MSDARCRGVVFAVLVCSAATGHAHTLASTIVSVAMTHHNVVNITIAAEADPLIAKLEALAGISAPDAPTSARQRRARIASLFPTLRAHMDARVGDTPLVLDLQDVGVDDMAQAEIHVAARMPAGPPTFTWRSTFVFGAYRLSTRSSAGEAIEWLQGPQTSTPVALDALRARDSLSAPGLTRVGHGFAMAAVVIYVIGRRCVTRTRYSAVGRLKAAPTSARNAGRARASYLARVT